MGDSNAALPYAFGGPAGTGAIKTSPEDFIVEEVLGFEPSDQGEHVFLRIEKRGENTDYVARQLARFAGVSARDIGYAGLKDRHGKTIQWFSVWLPGKPEPDWRQLESPSLRILQVRRNGRKLRKGAAVANRFKITVRELKHDPAVLEQRLKQVAARGVPNYFGTQRFGREGHNVAKASALFAGTLGRADPHRRGIYLSAARSYLFNRILASRVAQNNWDQAISGDVFMFSDSRSFFKPETITPEITQRIEAREIHPSGVLWGKGTPAVSDQALAIEAAIVEEESELCRGLEAFGLEMARRPLRLCPEGFNWELCDRSRLRLCFTLPSGAYATAVLRELIDIDHSDD
ncbi:tRNA pseudouridine(13) synthase TruD [Methylocaldum szegediense]|uniref:tRNA pseudouridine synthase D n=1 Tax=Methylocaldum szegediense TaxID=73780 RepID=A0ABN8X950_9GAMM|nr:tRNA pseudouridine(13) synthase TruD [Methylocaldum szegediense]CAI8953336.1 tRNA pseudouridine(13) synthase [Methylocaldum szegediense]